MKCFCNTCTGMPAGLCKPLRAQYTGKGDYILERIIDRKNEYIRYDGCLQINGLHAQSCGSMSLIDLSVIRIDPILCNENTDANSGRSSIRITLLCTVVDSMGCRQNGVSSVDIEIACGFAAEYGCNVRRAANIRLMHACQLGEASFEVRLDICLQTVISRAEILQKYYGCGDECPKLPIYPPISNPCFYKS